MGFIGNFFSRSNSRQPKVTGTLYTIESPIISTSEAVEVQAKKLAKHGKAQLGNKLKSKSAKQEQLDKFLQASRNRKSK